MKNSKTTGTSTPTAHITVNKNRLKRYPWGEGVEYGRTHSTSQYYMKDGNNFEIELFNPTQDVLKAEIKINGDLISGGGLVIKPGERVYLERYIDSNNKFLFETYEVEDSEEVNNAISNNGAIEIKFYRENKTTTNLFSIPTTHTYYYDNTMIGHNTNLSYDSSGNTNFLSFTTTNTGSNSFIDTNMILGSNVFDTNSGTVYNNEMDMVFEENGANIKTKETGRVGKGDESDQNFTDYSGSFSYYAFHTESFEIKPLSERPYMSDDLKKVKRYCGECGAKTKPKDKFCRMCGDKL